MVDISVIVPTLNEERYLEQSLQSIREQKTKLNFELIVSDGGSTDKTLQIAKKYADYSITAKKKGIAFGRNEGAKQSNGKLLVFIDADTRIPTHYLDVVHAVMRDADLAAISCGFRFDEKNNILKLVEEISNKYMLLKGSVGKGELLGFNNAINRELFFKVGGFPNVPLEDGALAKILREIKKVMFLPTPTVVTSARRLKKSGIIHSALYYTNLELLSISDNETLKKASLFKDYTAIR